ncbi:hypothetical protein BDK51DRAFT_51454 [Blyttiomyces helicus]|uniref:P-loop containing nucleoside triphosphate hydrolase protein n=1 Tax=Blyttiomyces helicus TaxID=388810 RepID=A0A4P9WAE0_9FUNG|nr:hypothetical protein BDK51DRAFT_51454 [Blyttiomyces helicus]|eukprot:RKO87206.1 hypothetical protein BDK51DRAFT_51454 [Blyttiomyces helicus]
MTETTVQEVVSNPSHLSPGRGGGHAALLDILQKRQSLGMAVDHEEALSLSCPLHCVLVGDRNSEKTFVVEALTGVADCMNVGTEIRIIETLPASNSARAFTTARRSDAKQVKRYCFDHRGEEQGPRSRQVQRIRADLIIVKVMSPDLPDLIIVDIPKYDVIEEVGKLTSLLEAPDVVILAVLPLA